MYQAPSPLPGAGLMISGPPQGPSGVFPQVPPPITSAGPSLVPYPWQQAPPTFEGSPSLIPPLLPSTPSIQQGVGVAVVPQQPAPQSTQQLLHDQSPSPETEI